MFLFFFLTGSCLLDNTLTFLVVHQTHIYSWFQRVNLKSFFGLAVKFLQGFYKLLVVRERSVFNVLPVC